MRALVQGCSYDESASKQNLPANSRPTNPTTASDGVTSETKPGGAGENVPAVSATKSPVEKAAAEAAEISKRALSLLNKPAAAAPAAAPAAPAPGAKSAADIAPGELSGEFHFKLAAMVLEDEEGRQWAEQFLAKKAGAEQAAELIKAAGAQQLAFAAAGAREVELIKQAHAKQAAELAEIEKALQALPENERELLVKAATVHNAALVKLDPWLGEHYKQGAADAAAMAESPEGQEAIPNGGAEVTPEMVVQVLQMLVQMQVIPEETAAQVMQQLSGGGGAPGGEGGAGAPPAPGGEGGAPPAPGGGGDGGGGPDEAEKAAAAAEIETLKQAGLIA